MTTSIGPHARHVERIVAEFVGRFADADRHGATVRTRQLLADGTPDAVIGEAVGLAQREVGARWQAGTWTITQEHAATAVAESILATLDEWRDQHGVPVTLGRVAVVAAEGEWHALPVRLAGHALAQEGLDVLYLGAGVPANDVARTLPSLEVDALAVSVTMPSNLVGAARTVAAGRAVGLPVLLGGWASNPDRARALGADAHAATVVEGARTVRSWITDGIPADRPSGRLDLRPTTRLRRSKPRIIDGAFDRVEDGWPALASDRDTPDDQVLEDLDQLLDHTAAALLLHDPALVVDELSWLGAVHDGRDLPAGLVDVEVEALLVALEEHAEARDLLAAARDQG
jgi:MerR family transcriptional regulator, light-induced transcriptional regulator